MWCFQISASGESSVPSFASIDLPPIQGNTKYLHRLFSGGDTVVTNISDGLSPSGCARPAALLRDGNYVETVVEVGMLEHSLTTDLLNHLVFVQKVFIKVSLCAFLYFCQFLYAQVHTLTIYLSLSRYMCVYVYIYDQLD